MGFAQATRGFFRDLFGSRLVERLEEDLLRQQQLYEERIQEYKSIIATMRTDAAAMEAKLARYEIALLPAVAQRPTETRKPSFAMAPFEGTVMTSWQKVVADHEAQLAKEAEEERHKSEVA